MKFTLFVNSEAIERVDNEEAHGALGRRDLSYRVSKFGIKAESYDDLVEGLEAVEQPGDPRQLEEAQTEGEWLCKQKFFFLLYIYNIKYGDPSRAFWERYICDAFMGERHKLNFSIER